GFPPPGPAGLELSRISIIRIRFSRNSTGADLRRLRCVSLLRVPPVCWAAGHDVVCNLATHIPPLARAADPRSWEENSRIRSEGSRNLVDAALAAGAT